MKRGASVVISERSDEPGYRYFEKCGLPVVDALKVGVLAGKRYPRVILDLMDYNVGYLRELHEDAKEIILLVGTGWTITPEVRGLCDLIIYQSILDPSKDVMEAPGADLLYGIQYILLGPEYTRQAEKIRDAMIYIGGGVSKYYAAKVQHDVNAWNVGAPLYGCGTIENSLYWSQSVSCVQVCTMGMCVYEGMAVGAVPLMISRSHDHADTANAIQREDCGISLGLVSRVHPSAVGEACRELLESPNLIAQMAQTGREMVDGRGVYRVAKRILEC